MIRSVRSNNPDFKTVEFHPGFNVVLADRNVENTSERKHTRNGAGKSTLIEIIHFCLEAQVTKNSVFKSEHLNGWSFTLTLDVLGKIFSIERDTSCPNKMYLEGDLSVLNFNYKYDKNSHRKYVSPAVFNREMLDVFYGIETNDNNSHYVPTFRELISYAIRKNVDGYRNAFEFFSRQKAYSVQSCNAYFLNLNMDYAAQFQSLKEKKKGIDDYKNAAKSGVIGNFSLNIGDLSTEVITRQKDVDALKKQLEAFQVHPQYEDISQKANNLTERMHSLTNTSILRQHLLERYESSYKEETTDIPIADIEKIYAEVGVLFGESIRRPLSEVIDFHKTIVANRKEYLSQEIAILKKEISAIKDEILDLSKQRAELMHVLETHGALDEYIIMQDRYTAAKQLLEDAKKRLESAEYIEDSSSHLKIENQELLLKSRQDYNERIHAREQAISLFKANTEFLYPESGILTIDLKESGYSFGIEIKSSRRHCKAKMKRKDPKISEKLYATRKSARLRVFESARPAH